MTKNNQELDTILSKLRKLKSLYEGAKSINSEGEANSAASAIQKLLVKYNLSIDEIGENKPKDEVKHEISSGFTFKNIGGEWENRLTYVLCKWNFCRCFVYGNSYKTLLLVGEKDNLETVKWLRGMLSSKFVEFSKKRYKEYKYTSEYARNPISLDKYQRSYLMGCAAGLDDKLAEEDAEMKKNDAELGTKVTALVLRKDTAVKEYVADKFGKAGKRSSKERMDSARKFGYEDGKNTSIHKQVSSSRNSQASGVKLLG